MATLNLLPRKTFEIILDDGTVIKGQFGTWALRRFCDKMKYSLAESDDHLMPYTEATPNGKMGVGDVIEYILSAVENSARKEGKPFSYTDVHCGDWIDQLGGITVGGDAIKLLLHSNSELTPATTTDQEKKTID